MQKSLQAAPAYDKTTYFFRDGKDTVYFRVMAYQIHKENVEPCPVSKEKLKQDIVRIGRAAAVQIRLREKKVFAKKRKRNGRI